MSMKPFPLDLFYFFLSVACCPKLTVMFIMLLITLPSLHLPHTPLPSMHLLLRPPFGSPHFSISAPPCETNDSGDIQDTVCCGFMPMYVFEDTLYYAYHLNSTRKSVISGLSLDPQSSGTSLFQPRVHVSLPNDGNVLLTAFVVVSDPDESSSIFYSYVRVRENKLIVVQHVLSSRSDIVFDMGVSIYRDRVDDHIYTPMVPSAERDVYDLLFQKSLTLSSSSSSASAFETVYLFDTSDAITLASMNEYCGKFCPSRLWFLFLSALCYPTLFAPLPFLFFYHVVQYSCIVYSCI